MGVKSFLSKPFAAFVKMKIDKWANNPADTQRKVFNSLIKKAKNTAFGQDHDFENIQSYQDFQARVPLRDYEELRPYIEQILKGKPDVLWPGKPLYFSKTSGTTSGIKYIPISKESIGYHINSARDALLCYINETGKSNFLDGKLIFLSGSPEMTKKAGVLTGRLSGIVNHHIPSYLKKNQKPSYKTNCIEDWEDKLEAIIEETQTANMTLISGIPPWVQMYFDSLKAKFNKPIKDIFPKFELFVYGGVNFQPYRAKLFETIGKEVDSIETYPASEGFIAYQDSQKEEGLLLLLKNGMFYEFVPLDEWGNDNPRRLTIEEVELGINYVIILNTNAGLWGYVIGDTVKFVSNSPYRVVVSGRVKHYISAFGEHVIGEEVEKAMKKACAAFPETEVIEFTVAPFISTEEGKSYHEWFVEFAQKPQDMDGFKLALDQALCEYNIYYDDLITGNILKKLKLTSVKKDTFRDYMKSIGKLGGQNKVPRLANDRKIADALEVYIEIDN